MKKILTLLLTIVAINANCQDIKIDGGSSVFEPIQPTVIENTSIRCQYRQTIVNDTLNKDQAYTKESVWLLQIGKNTSKYIDVNSQLSDSLLNVYGKNGDDFQTIVNKLGRYKRMANKLIIYKNYPKGKITSTYHAFGSYYISEEEMNTPKWAISTQSSEKILGYNCKKATTTFKGRKYIAWFTTDIPVSEGPWKLSGLPGLILKATDTKGQITFECISLEKLGWEDPIYLKKHAYTKTTIAKINDVINRFELNPTSFIQNNPDIQTTKSLTAPSKKRYYNPIELCE